MDILDFYRINALAAGLFVWIAHDCYKLSLNQFKKLSNRTKFSVDGSSSEYQLIDAKIKLLKGTGNE